MWLDFITSEDLINCFFSRAKNLPPEVREAQEKKLDELKKQQEIQTRLAVERKIQLRDRKIKFFGIANLYFSFTLITLILFQ